MVAGYRQLSFGDLEILVAVIEEGSLASVARALNVTPSKISKTIKKIENSCGIQVLQRSNAGVQLHPEAHALLEFAQDISLLSNRLSLKGSAPSSADKLISLAAPSYIQLNLVAKIRAELERHFPSIRFQFMESSADRIIQLSVDQRFDIAICPGKMNLTKAYYSESVGKMTWGLYARSQHPISRHVEQAELKTAKFIAPFILESKNWKYGDDKGYPAPESRNVQDMIETAAGGLQLALETDQLTYLPEIVARPHVKNGSLKLITVKGKVQHKEDLYIHAHQDRIDKLFLDKLTQIVSRILN